LRHQRHRKTQSQGKKAGTNRFHKWVWVR
jgi:hypothetical protein